MTTTSLPLDDGTRLARARNVIGSEWTKLWSVRSTYWVLLCAAVTAIGLGAIIANADVGQWPKMSPSQQAAFDPLPDPYIGFMVAQLIFATLGVLSVTGEYSTGLIRTTFTAVPTRRAVLAAKAVVVAAVTVPVGAIIATATFATGQAILSQRHVGLSIGDPGALRSIVAATFYLVAVALVGLGLGALLRHTAAAIGALVTLLFLAPQFVHGTSRWAVDIDNALPGSAIRRLVSLHLYHGAPSMPQAFIVIAVYPAVLVVAAMILIHRRDA
jgi:ABC-2 type transport system permease protein